MPRKQKHINLVPIVMSGQNTMSVMSLSLQSGTAGVTQIVATNVSAVPSAPAVTNSTTWLPLGHAKIRFQWYYTRRGVEKVGRKTVSVHFNGVDLSDMVNRIVQFIRDNERPGEAENARLEVHLDTGGLSSPLRPPLYDLRCSVRVMNKVKKRFSYING